jgi:hypothetical protein
MAREMGRELATPAEARAAFGLTPWPEKVGAASDRVTVPAGG